MSLDGGWQYWSTSDIREFKLGYAALPRMKTNKNINFDDFWILGRESKVKDAGWKVMRVLTSVEATSAYSKLSLTPPTPRESLTAWLNEVSKYSGQTVADLTKVTTGAIKKERSQESPDHLFLQHPKITDTYTNEIYDPIMNNQGSAKDVIAKGTKTMDDVVKGIYDQFKDSLPKD
jgi:ABC-type glycerol-3-phosphate transport system substrate-binding protein